MDDEDELGRYECKRRLAGHYRSATCVSYGRLELVSGHEDGKKRKPKSFIFFGGRRDKQPRSTCSPSVFFLSALCYSSLVQPFQRRRSLHHARSGRASPALTLNLKRPLAGDALLAPPPPVFSGLRLWGQRFRCRQRMNKRHHSKPRYTYEGVFYESAGNCSATCLFPLGMA